MPAQPGPRQLDVGNQLLEPANCQATATVLTAPDGAQFILLTIRTTSATLSVFLNKDQAETWRDLLDDRIARMTGLALGQPAPDPLPFPAFPNGGHDRGRM